MESVLIIDLSISKNNVYDKPDKLVAGRYSLAESICLLVDLWIEEKKSIQEDRQKRQVKQAVLTN